jgi:hypothetical protein
MKANSTVITIGIIVVVLGGAYWYTHKESSSTAPVLNVQPTGATPDQLTNLGNYANLFSTKPATSNVNPGGVMIPA